MRSFRPAGFFSYLPDSVTAATVLTTKESVGISFWINSIIGNVPGSLGETSVIALGAGGIYLYYKKIANRSIILSTFVGMLLLQIPLWFFGANGAVDPITATLSGGFVLGLFFMVTDPISAPKNKNAVIIYGVFVGAMTSLIRTFSVWPEGMMFAILLANMFAPITDYAMNELKKKKKSKA